MQHHRDMVTESYPIIDQPSRARTFFNTVRLFLLIALAVSCVVIAHTSKNGEKVQSYSFASKVPADLLKEPALPTYNIALSKCFDPSLPVAKGMDVVTFFQSKGPQRGIPSIREQYGNYTFWFSSEVNRKRFVAYPEKYLPAWGSFCSFGISHEQKLWGVDGVDLGPPFDIAVYHIGIDGRLYFFRDMNVRSQFLENEATSILEGNRFWKIRTDGRMDIYNTYCSCDSSIWPVECFGPMK